MNHCLDPRFDCKHSLPAWVDCTLWRREGPYNFVLLTSLDVLEAIHELATAPIVTHLIENGAFGVADGSNRYATTNRRRDSRALAS